MEDNTLKKPTMVSRLPKFGSRPTSAAGPLTNGSAHIISSGLAKGVHNGKQDGIIRVPAPFPIKAKKGREDCGEKIRDCGEEARGALHSQQQLGATVTVRQIRKPSTAPVGKIQRPIPSVFPSPRTVTQPMKTNPHSTTPKQPSPIRPLCKVGQSIFSANQGSSSSPQGSQSTLSQSSDSIKYLTVENAGRSQSFSYLKRPTAATQPPLIRSFSFNRATELAKELPRPLAQFPVASSPVTQASMVLGCVTKPTTAACTISSIPPSALKKPLLPNYTDVKPSSLSYKLMRPSLLKHSRLVMPLKVQSKIEVSERDGDSRGKATLISEPSSNTHSAGTTPDSVKEETDCQGQPLEILEDMSLSSTSSLEHNDVSEEYMDDFDDLGNGGGILLMSVHEGKNENFVLFKDEDPPVGQCHEGSSVTSLHSFVSKTVDWAQIGLTGHGEVAAASHYGGTRAHGSSLELSPSDSSGGTYMWDEEVLEPIGEATQLCGSYDSNLNSMDILSNLENLDSCDLEDDDLILDLPEDVSLHSDVAVAPPYNHSERKHRPWRKREQCRGNPEQSHYEGRDGVLQPFDDRHILGSSGRGSGQSCLDELMMENMVQDCSSIKQQLFHLRTLLQMEDDGSAEQLVSSTSSEEPSYCHVDVLLKEVQKLREELKVKDMLICKLTQQLSAPVVATPCSCQQGELQRREHWDQSTQTPWRTQCPQILQPFQSSVREHNRLGRPSRQALSEAPSDHVEVQPSDGPLKPLSCPVVTLASSVPTTAPAVSAAAASLSCSTLNSDHLLLLNTRLPVNESHSPRANPSRTHPQPGDLHTFCRDRKDPVLMKTRGDEQVGFGRGTQSALFGPHLSFSNNARTRPLPPPSRGLPRISSVSQTIPVPSTQVRMISAPRGEISSVQAQEQSNACSSRLPKPKNH